MRLSRRRFVLRSGGLLAAVSAPFALSPSRVMGALNSSSAVEGMKSVVSSMPGRVRVAGVDGLIRTDGFPGGWEVAVGDRVAVLADGSSGLTAFPAVHWQPEIIDSRELAPGATFGGNSSFRLDAAAVLANVPESDAAGPRAANICVVDRDSRQGPDRVISIRW